MSETLWMVVMDAYEDEFDNEQDALAWLSGCRSKPNLIPAVLMRREGTGSWEVVSDPAENDHHCGSFAEHGRHVPRGLGGWTCPGTPKRRARR